MEQATRFAKGRLFGTIRKTKKKQERNNERDATIKIPTLSFTKMEIRCHACVQPGNTSTKCAHKSKIPKEQLAINLARTRTKSKIIAGHQAQRHALAAVPSSDSTTLTTVMTPPMQAPPLQTIQMNSNNEIGLWTNTQVGVVISPTAGVSFSQTHAHEIGNYWTANDP